MIGMTIQDKLLGILDRDEPLARWDLANQSLGPGGLPGAGRPGDDYVLRADRKPHESDVFLCMQQPQEFAFGVIERSPGAPRVSKIPRRARSSTDQTSSEGRRMVIATASAVVAGGRTICTRSPPGSDAETGR